MLLVAFCIALRFCLLVSALQLPSVAVWELGTELSLVSARNSEIMGKFVFSYKSPQALCRLQPGRRGGSGQSLVPPRGTRVALASCASTLLVTD